MDRALPAALSQVAVPLPEDAPASRGTGPLVTALPPTSTGPANGPAPGGAAAPEWLRADGASTVRAAWTVAPRASRPPVAKGKGTGYARPTAPAAPKPKASPAPAPSTAKTAQAKPTGEWAFLSDAHTSIEDKLFRFMQLVQRKMDDDLTKKMEDYRAKHTTGGTASDGSAKKSGFDLLGFVKTIFPPVGIVDRLIGGDGGLLVKALEGLGGPLLASLATALGFPQLAPFALQAGGDLLGSVARAVGGSSSSSSSSSSQGTKKTESGTPDERLSMLEIQRLVEKQNQMFALVSNILKGMHDTGMGVVNNIR
jgi:hypothetical protein